MHSIFSVKEVIQKYERLTEHAGKREKIKLNQ